MRVSPRRHVLAVLRLTIRKSQKEMAELLDCSPATVQAIELGKLALSDTLAQRICDKTGISDAWLRANDVTEPPYVGGFTGLEKVRYTQEHFEAQSARSPHLDPIRAIGSFGFSDQMLAGVFLAAYRRGEIGLCAFKLHKALDELSDRFGCATEFLPSDQDIAGPSVQQVHQIFSDEIAKSGESNFYRDLSEGLQKLTAERLANLRDRPDIKRESKRVSRKRKDKPTRP